MYPLCIGSSGGTTKWIKFLIGTGSSRANIKSSSFLFQILLSKAFNVKDETHPLHKNRSFVSFCIPCSDNLTSPKPSFDAGPNFPFFCSSFLRQFMHPLLFASSRLLTKPLSDFGTASDLSGGKVSLQSSSETDGRLFSYESGLRPSSM